MAKSRAFSLYLLKSEFDSENSLQDDHDLGEKVTDARNLPEGAVLYVSDKNPQPPWWKAYWGIQQHLEQALKGAIAFIPVDDRWFVLTFGHTYHTLKEDSYEYDFGLRTTLNALHPEKVKSTSILEPEKSKRAVVQSPTVSDINFFDIRQNESILKTLSGKVRDEYKELFGNVSGTSSLHFTTKRQALDLVDLCRQALEIYKKDDYKEQFPGLQNIQPVKDPNVLEKLNAELLAEFETPDTPNLVLTIPEFVDDLYAYQVNYSGEGKSKLVFEDIYIRNYREYLEERDVTSVNLDLFKKHQLNLIDENGDKKKSYFIFKCLQFDCEVDERSYHLCDGEWFEIDKDFVSQLAKELDGIITDQTSLPECNERREDDYNIAAANKLSAVCMDKTNISPSGQTQVEPCDLFIGENSRANFVHVKISTRSSALSHLFNQGINSIQAIRNIPASKDKMKELLADQSFAALIDSGNFSVTYAIITGKENFAEKSKLLPIFSRISLQRTFQSLRTMGVPCEVVLIRDNVNRKDRPKEEAV